MRFNPPPGWPTPPEGWTPPTGWTPDPSWPAPPAGWPLFLPDEATDGKIAAHKAIDDAPPPLANRPAADDATHVTTPRTISRASAGKVAQVTLAAPTYRWHIRQWQSATSDGGQSSV